MKLVQDTVKKQLESLPLLGVMMELGFEEHFQNSKLPEWFAMVHPEWEELLLVYLQKGEFRYYNPSHPSDSGSVLDFLTFRINRFEIQQKQSLWEKLLHLISNFDMNSFSMPKKAQQLKEVKIPEHFFLAGLTECDHKVFGKCGISEKTLKSETFSSRIWTMGNVLCFPLQDRRGKVIGQFQEQNGNSGFLKYGDQGRGIWLGNIRKGQKAIIVVQHPLDALSHYELYPSEQILYIALPGKLHREQLDSIQRLAEEQHIKKILIGFPNTVKGLLRDFVSLEQRIRRSLPAKIGQDLSQEQVIVELPVSENQKPLIQGLLSHIKKFNQEQKAAFHKVYVLEHATALAKGILRLVPMEHNQGFRLYIPKSQHCLKYGLWLLQKHFGVGNEKISVGIVKSLGQTWQDDLKSYQSKENQKNIEENMRKTAS